MPPPQTVLELVQRFDTNATDYRSQDYKEAQLRQEFINPFFECLGWDMSNKQGFAEAYKDVVHEDAIKIGTSMKAPDYSFRIGGARKFFLEAKKPAVGIKSDPAPAYQLRRYAWSTSLHYILAVLNSKLLSWYFRTVNSVARRDDFPKIIIQQTKELPVPAIDFTNTADKSRHDQIVSLVDRMLSLHTQLAAAKAEQVRATIQGQIDATDREIDRLVYELYGLTADEIRIVEATTNYQHMTLPQILADLNTELGTQWQDVDVPELPVAPGWKS